MVPFISAIKFGKEILLVLEYKNKYHFKSLGATGQSFSIGKCIKQADKMSSVCVIYEENYLIYLIKTKCMRIDCSIRFILL